MPVCSHFNDSIHWHVAEITARVVAQSGIPSDRFHLGKIILQSLKDDPERVLQIDAATGQTETNAEALRRIIKCAISLKAMGLQKGDVMLLVAPTHVDLAIPFYAALCLGLAIAPIDRTLGVAEMKDTFDIAKPKIVFCQSEKISEVLTALERSGCEAKIVTFDKSDHINFNDLLDQSCDEDAIQNYKPTDFDSAETLATVIATSGTTGPPKLAAVTHKNYAISGSYYWCRSTEFPPFNAAMVVAPLQWLSAIIVYICGPYLKFTRLQSSQTLTRERIYDMINTYKPQYTLLSPTLMTTLMKPGDRDNCDFSCFKIIMVAGSAVHQNLISDIKTVSPDTDVVNTYGMSELTGLAFVHGHSSPPASCGKPLGGFQYKTVAPDTDVVNTYGMSELTGLAFVHGHSSPPASCGKPLGGFQYKTVAPDTDVVNTYGMSELTGLAFVHGHSSPPASCGKPLGGFQYKLVDFNTGKEVLTPHLKGELWVKGPGMFKGYYNRPEVTREAFEDGWFKTGDIFYRDEAWNFFFVERIKLLLKYKNHQISPVEVEAVILEHPGVLDVVVTGIPDEECGELPVACVVPREDQPPTAQEIKDLVKASLTDTKQLRGGVIFMAQFPTTKSTKIHRMKIREMVLNMKRE